MFRDYLSVPTLRVKLSKKSNNLEDGRLRSIMAEAWGHTRLISVNASRTEVVKTAVLRAVTLCTDVSEESFTSIFRA